MRDLQKTLTELDERTTRRTLESARDAIKENGFTDGTLAGMLSAALSERLSWIVLLQVGPEGSTRNELDLKVARWLGCPERSAKRRINGGCVMENLVDGGLLDLEPSIDARTQPKFNLTEDGKLAVARMEES